MPVETVVVFEGVNMRFGDRTLFRQLDHCFGSSKSYAILGPSGSGKTTLLALIGALLRPAVGQVRYSRSGLGRLDPRFAWITQTTNSIGSRSALDNVSIGLLASGEDWNECRKRARVLLRDLGLSHLQHRRCRTLSGGELQRIVVARALISEADFILADEPTGQLDRSTSVEIAAALAERRGRSGLLVATHDPDVASVCDIVLEIRERRLVDVE